MPQVITTAASIKTENRTQLWTLTSLDRFISVVYPLCDIRLTRVKFL